jgi:hypothetical protein
MRSTVYIFGQPADCGGANTELWHLLRLLRSRGWPITLVPTWSIRANWRARVEQIGCTVRLEKPATVALPDHSLVLALCNAPFLAASHRLRNCGIIYAPCMCAPLDPIESHVLQRDGPFDAYVFQSHHQAACYRRMLCEHGIDTEPCGLRRWKYQTVHAVIRGAFDAADFPHQPLPHADGEPFHFGRLSRPDPRKFRSDLWDLARHGPGTLHVMGWSRAVAVLCGPPPPGAAALPKNALPAREFLAGLHALVQLGDVDENWPRVGLEAMAAGVPVIADDRGGWREMLEHGRTGFLAGDTRAAVEYLHLLARDEALRLSIVAHARQKLLEELADPDILGAAWERLLCEVAA